MSSETAPHEVATEDGPEEYWKQARRPWPSLVFLVPFLVIYEFGVIAVAGGEGSVTRNGADVWMRVGLGLIGEQFALLLPVLVIGTLLTWHLVARHQWTLRLETLVGMLAESLLFAFVLLVLGQCQSLLFAQFHPGAVSIGETTVTGRSLAYVGAGIYEEFLFRLLLLPGCYGLFRLARLTPGWSVVLSIVTVSLLFSLAHCVGPGGEPFSIFAFVFRALAGVYFAALFYSRGFGITVGCHAAYDLLVGVLLLPGES